MTSSQHVLLAALHGAWEDDGIRVIPEKGEGGTFLVLRLTRNVAVGISGLDVRRAAELVDRLRCSVARTDVLVAQHLTDVMAALDEVRP